MISPKPKRNPEREKRITCQIIADAHDSEERAMGWYGYLQDELSFPFRAACIAAHSISPLKKGEEVRVLGMAPKRNCGQEMIVLIEWSKRKLGVPLAQLRPVGDSLNTKRAVEDWQYWTGMGYEF